MKIGVTPRNVQVKHAIRIMVNIDSFSLAYKTRESQRVSNRTVLTGFPETLGSS
jgi:hypothetical protein